MRGTEGHQVPTQQTGLFLEGRVRTRTVSLMTVLPTVPASLSRRDGETTSQARSPRQRQASCQGAPQVCCGPIMASVAPGALEPLEASTLGSNHLPTEAVPAELSEMRRSMEKAACPGPHPHDEASPLRQKLQVRDKGNGVLRGSDLALRGSDLALRDSDLALPGSDLALPGSDVALQGCPDGQLEQSQQLQRLAEEWREEWQQTQRQQDKDLRRLYLAHLLAGVGRAPEEGPGPASEQPGQPEAAGHPQAKEKHRAAPRAEKNRRGEPIRQQTWPPKARKKAGGTGRQGATRATGLPAPGLSPPEKSKGKRLPSPKAGGASGRHAGGPRASRGLYPQKPSPLLITTRASKGLDGRPRGRALEGTRPLGRGTTRFVQSLRSAPRDQSPDDKWKDLEQLWPVGSTHGRSAVPRASPREREHPDKSKWQKELEFAFEELFNTNRKLKKHLSLYLKPRPGVGQSHISEVREYSMEAPREKGVMGADTLPTGASGSPVEVHAPQTPSKPDLRQLLSQIGNLKHPMARPTMKNEGQTSSCKVGALLSEEDFLSCSAGSGQEAPKPATLGEGSHQLLLPEQVDGINLTTSKQKLKAEMEQRRQKQLELLEQTEHPNLSLEIHYTAELEEERRQQRRDRLAILKSYSTSHQENRGSCFSTSSPLCTSVLEDCSQDQMIRDLKQQIVEQSELHKQFLEEARKRLQEFQKLC
ncbi:protein DDC8 homolog [Tupaia chinensis]|uniref:protein DDC8 homolog n=1 Tax=Tupaia chinensis TaxID=246437 RepID=UPI000FFB8F1F|nr:protein DDC8 homolog [Tupaia chinensis]